MITTIYGDMDESLLTKKEGETDSPTDLAKWVEYYKGDELVHRSVHVHLKQGLGIESTLGSIG